MSARVARIDRIGGPEVIEWHDVDLPAPAAGEVRIAHHAVGLNFIDVYHRSGVYPVSLPSGLGSEAAGTIEAVGEGVEGFAVGDRVGTFGPTRGAYASARNVAADQVVPLPDAVNFDTAAAIMLKGATAAFLVEDCAKVAAGQMVLVHAAAGGVGHLLVGWLKAVGAVVIGTAGTAEKAARATAAGADHVIVHTQEDVVARVRAITDGAGVSTVFDGVGAATWDVSLASAARRGLIVSYGNAGGAVEGVKLATLASHGSLFVTRPTLFDYAVSGDDKRRIAARVFAMLARGAIVPEIGRHFPLERAADAHRALEAGETQGSTVLVV
ncbi:MULTISPECIES: quinone oxidoreductase [unclassified Sphingomonas]|uniref:quinone oxidoreductase family protein n=1 Tax=unclassified Sphingomonas TaxID=196159 RepID=UPI00226ABA9A